MNGYDLLGVRVHALDAQGILGLIARAVAEDRRLVIANHNLHSIYLFHRDEKMRRLYATAAAIHIDGMPLVAWGRLLGLPLSRRHRVTYHAFVPLLAERAAAEGWRVFYLGSREDVLARGVELLRRMAPGLEIATAAGYFDPHGPDNDRVLRRIQAFRAQVLLVGMGMPRQEHWILDNLDRLDVNAVLPVGAAIEWVAGEIPSPPGWMASNGLQWFWRLIRQPRQVWRRYLVEPWALLPLAWRDLLGRWSAAIPE
ncbi:MAG: glycosyl transferase [Actinomycetota bacterium]|nr:MAG: glycosyl transferase [Actinomycetota bacterium]